MAWIYLLAVILVFYTPIVGLGPALLQTDIELGISGFRFPIPFTGSLWLLLYSSATWYLLWKITSWVEKRFEFDIFYWLDGWLPFLHLRERWMYTTRPSISGRLAAQAATAGLVVSLSKVVGVLLLGVSLAFVVPQIIQSILPGLMESLLSQFASAEWVGPVVEWIGGPLTEWLAGTLMGWLRDAHADILEFDLHASLFSLSILVLLADRAFRREREERYYRDIERVQKARKFRQQDIVISYTAET